MKRMIACILVIALSLSVSGCGNGESTDEMMGAKTDVYELGETVSTDVAEFTLEESQFTYYVIENEPVESLEPGARYAHAAKIGYCLVTFTFTITNKDRVLVNFAGYNYSMDWNPSWKIIYDGNEYELKSREELLPSGISLSGAYTINKETGETKPFGSINAILYPGQTSTYMTFGIVEFDPETLTDGYYFTVNVPAPGETYETFTYRVPTRDQQN